MPKTIGIIDADLLDNGTRHPNLALMKISGYQKELGNDVTLLEDYYSIPKYDEVYLSRVFDFTNVPIDPKNYPNLHIGGTGFFWMTAPDLPLEVEHHMPDYHLYDEYVGRQIARASSPDLQRLHGLQHRLYHPGLLPQVPPSVSTRSMTMCSATLR